MFIYFRVVQFFFMSCDVAVGAGCIVLFYVLIVMLQWMRGCTFLFNVLTVMLQWVKEGVGGGGSR